MQKLIINFMVLNSNLEVIRARLSPTQFARLAIRPSLMGNYSFIRVIGTSLVTIPSSEDFSVTDVWDGKEIIVKMPNSLFCAVNAQIQA